MHFESGRTGHKVAIFEVHSHESVLQKAERTFLFLPGLEVSAHTQPLAPPSAARVSTIKRGRRQLICSLTTILHLPWQPLRSSVLRPRCPSWAWAPGRNVCKDLDTYFPRGGFGHFLLSVGKAQRQGFGEVNVGPWRQDRGCFAFSGLIQAAKLQDWLFPAVVRALLASIKF